MKTYKITLKSDETNVKNTFYRYIRAVREGCHLANGLLSVYTDEDENGFIYFNLQLSDCIIERQSDKHYLFLKNLLSEMYDYKTLFVSEQID